jgi:hypothetical protein
MRMPRFPSNEFTNHSSSTTVRAGLFMGCLLLALQVAGAQPVSPPATNAPPGAPGAPSAPPSKYKDFVETTRGFERQDGLFTLYRSNETLYAEIKPQQLNQPLIAPMTIARGMAMAGTPLNFGDEWILVFRRAGDKVQVLRRNIHYKAPEGTPLQKAVTQNYTDSILLAVPIVSINPGTQGILVDFGQIFLTDFADLRLGSLDRNRCTWAKIKAFPKNVELQVEATFTGRGGFSGMGMGDDGVVDSRGLTLVIHYSLAKLPEPGYKPRLADQRVGHFLNATKDFGSTDPDTPFLRHINRWRLEKADPKAKVSPPKKQVVWWVEDTVPQEFRPYVEEGILEWNKAFEKIGIRNAMAVRWQNERDEFDPEDINYCTFRWITTSSTFAMSGLRSDPLTGEMVDGDVIFDASWIRYWKREYAFLIGSPVPRSLAEESSMGVLAVGEIISPMMAAKQGYGLPFPLPAAKLRSGVQAMEQGTHYDLVPAQWTPLHMELRRRAGAGKFAACQFSSMKLHEYSLAAMALAAAEGGTNDTVKLPEDFLGQAIKEVVMHEVGHSLGLRHNFKASTMLNYEQINDTSVTRVKGMSGSVMDYNPINVAPKGKKQGDYASTTLGPYDYWAIEYAYRPIEGDEAAELKKIAARSPDPDLTYATDEDLMLDDDPLINVFDMGSDPMQFGKERMALASDLLKSLDEKVVREGESWARLRAAFSVLLSQYGNAAFLAANYLGGQFVSRDFKAKGGRDPIVPVPGDKQREALQFLADNVLSDKNFQFSAPVLRRLGVEHWYHWGSDAMYMYGGGVDFPIYSRVLALQRIVLNQCFSPSILARIQNQELQAAPDTKPIRIEEVFKTATETIWSELSGTVTNYTIIRRNLQREHLRRLMSMVIGSRSSSFESTYGYVVFAGASGVPADARSLARMHLADLRKRMTGVLDQAGSNLDETTRAHLVECRERINKALDSTYTSSEL